MGQVAVDDLFQVTYKGVLFNQVIETVMHARVDDIAAINTSRQNVALDLANKLSDPVDNRMVAYLSCVGPELAIKSVRVQFIKPERVVYAETAGGGIGTFTGSVKSSNQAASMTKQSSVIGKKGIGRIQLAGVPTAGEVGGLLDPTYQALLQTQFGTQFVGSFSGGFIYSAMQFRWCLPAGGVNHGYDLFDIIVQPTLRVMRRRTVGLGI